MTVSGHLESEQPSHTIRGDMSCQLTCSTSYARDLAVEIWGLAWLLPKKKAFATAAIYDATW